MAACIDHEGLFVYSEKLKSAYPRSASGRRGIGVFTLGLDSITCEDFYGLIRRGIALIQLLPLDRLEQTNLLAQQGSHFFSLQSTYLTKLFVDHTTSTQCPHPSKSR